MLLIYLLDGHPKYSRRVADLLEVSIRREDQLFISYLGLGELMAGDRKSSDFAVARHIQNELDDIGFSYLPFDGLSVGVFASLRAIHHIKSPDAINLACAAGAGVDLFLTGDQRLLKLEVPGIHFIADFDTPLL